MKGLNPFFFLSEMTGEMTGDIYRDKYNERNF